MSENEDGKRKNGNPSPKQDFGSMSESKDVRGRNREAECKRYETALKAIRLILDDENTEKSEEGDLVDLILDAVGK